MLHLFKAGPLLHILNECTTILIDLLIQKDTLDEATMSSVDNILGLVSHLHSMESSFSAILIEAAMKLASLTDANLFVLVETKDGRRFAGKRHLCNLYTSGELAPMGSDLEMEVDPSVIGLRARYVGNQTGPNNDLPSSEISTTSRPSSSSLPSQSDSESPTKRGVSTSPPKAGQKRLADTTEMEERKKMFLPNEEGKRRDSIKCEAVELRANSSSVITGLTQSAAVGNATNTIQKSPRQQHLQHQGRGAETLPVMTDSGSQTEFFVDQSYIEPFAGHFLESEDEFKTMLQNQSGSQFEGSALQLPLTCGLDPSSGSDSHETCEDDQRRQLSQQLQQHQHQDHPTHRHGTDSSNEEEERKPYDHVMGWNTTEFLSKSVRANNVLSINDSSLADKSSSNHRMFMSLIHEYTKESVKYVPEEKMARKEFVDKIFFNFWLYFPHLDTLHNLGAKISIGKRFYFLKAFVRAGIARGLSSILGRRSSYSQETLDNIDKKLTEMRRN